MIRALHTADVQIDATMPELGRKAERRRNDLLQTFEQLVALAIRENVHLFLVSGNLFATPRPDEAAIQRVSSALKRLTARGILPVLLPGDCDGLVTPDSVYFRDAFSNLLVLDGRDPSVPATVRVSGRTVHLYGFCQRGEQPLPPENLRIDEEGSHLALVCFSNRINPEPALIKRISSWGMDYVACAPSTQWQVLEGSDTVFGCSPGSPEGFAASHTGNRHVALVQLEGESLHVERRKVNRRQLDNLTLDLAEFEQPADLLERILSGANNDLLRKVELNGTPRFAIDIEAIHSACSGAFFNLDIDDSSSVFKSSPARDLIKQPTSVGEFMRRAETMSAELPSEEGKLVEEAARLVLAARSEEWEAGDETA